MSHQLPYAQSAAHNLRYKRKVWVGCLYISDLFKNPIVSLTHSISKLLSPSRSQREAWAYPSVREAEGRKHPRQATNRSQCRHPDMHIHTHTITPRGNLTSPVHQVACLWTVGGSPHREEHADSTQKRPQTLQPWIKPKPFCCNATAHLWCPDDLIIKMKISEIGYQYTRLMVGGNRFFLMETLASIKLTLGKMGTVPFLCRTELFEDLLVPLCFLVCFVFVIRAGNLPHNTKFC